MGMWFEPLRDLLHHHGENLQDKLNRMLAHLATISQNTEAQLARNQWASRSIEAAKETTGELRNDSAYGWLVRSAFVSQAGNVYLASVSADSQLAAFEANNRDDVRWYIPPGGILFYENTSENTGHLNLQIEVLVTSSKDATTGRSLEHVDMPQRIESAPSGTPLDEVTIP